MPSGSDSSLECNDALPQTVTEANNHNRLGRRLHMLSCTFCRRDKKKCIPQSRAWPKKCNRCEERGFACSELVRKQRRSRINRLRTNDLGKKDGHLPDLQTGALPNPLPSTNHLNLVMHEETQAWDLKDLGNALGMLQLVALEYIEQEASYHAAVVRLRHHCGGIYGSLQARFWDLNEFLNVFQPTLQSEVMRRLEREQGTASMDFLAGALNTLASPLSGMLINPFFLSPSAASRPKFLQPSVSASALEKRAMSLVADGQLALGVIYYHKSMAQSLRQPEVGFVTALKSHNLPNLMATTAKKFGLKGHYVTPTFWVWTSMIFPSVIPRSQLEVMETLCIKTWIGFDNALDFLGIRILNHGSPGNWKQVFRWICSHPLESKTDIDGRTSLHLAVLLGMREEVSLLCRTSNLDLCKRDKSGRTPLHLAAILGDESICDILLGAKNAHNAILIKDAGGRRPLWYAGEYNKHSAFKKLLHATLRYMTLSNICSEKDKEGQILGEYCTAHGLAGSELLHLAEYSEYPAPVNIRPDLYATPDQAWQSQMSIISGNGLSSWAGG